MEAFDGRNCSVYWNFPELFLILAPRNENISPTMISPRWQIIPTDEKAEQALHAALGIDPLFCRLLVQRGIKTFEEARTFFRPSLDDLHNPFLMKDMDLAVERLDKALKGDERILLYGDYDVDGVTSVALLSEFLGGLGWKVGWYLPHRLEEGYGLSQRGVEHWQHGRAGIRRFGRQLALKHPMSLAEDNVIAAMRAVHETPEGGKQ